MKGRILEASPNRITLYSAFAFKAYLKSSSYYEILVILILFPSEWFSRALLKQVAEIVFDSCWEYSYICKIYDWTVFLSLTFYWGFGWEQDEETAPGSFPFKIEDNPGHQTVTLTREYKGEHIKVVVSMPSFDSDENDDEDDEDGHSNGSSIPLVVTVTKKSGLSLEFSCMAFPDEIAIDALSVCNQGSTLEDKLANEGPDFE